MKTKASRSLKWLYCLTIIAAIIPSELFGAAGWVGLATGGGILSAGILSVVTLFAIFTCGVAFFVVSRSSAYPAPGCQASLFLKQAACSALQPHIKKKANLQTTHQTKYVESANDAVFEMRGSA